MHADSGFGLTKRGFARISLFFTGRGWARISLFPRNADGRGFPVVYEPRIAADSLFLRAADCRGFPVVFTSRGLPRILCFLRNADSRGCSGFFRCQMGRMVDETRTRHWTRGFASVKMRCRSACIRVSLKREESALTRVASASRREESFGPRPSACIRVSLKREESALIRVHPRQSASRETKENPRTSAAVACYHTPLPRRAT